MTNTSSSATFFAERDLEHTEPEAISLTPALAPEVFQGQGAVQLRMPIPEQLAEDGALKAYWRGLRRFFRSGDGGGIPAKAGLVPALLAPYSQTLALQHGYPVWMPDHETLSKATFPEEQCWPVSHMLRAAVAQFAPGDEEALALKNNLDRLGKIIQQRLDATGEAVPAPPLWETATQELQKELQLKGVEGLMLSGDLSKLLRHLPPGGVCIPFSPNTPFALLASLLDQGHQRRITRVEELIKEVMPRLKELLMLERNKRPEAQDPAQLEKSMDFAGAFVNFEALSGVLPEGQVAGAEEERYQRLQRVFGILDQALVSIGAKSAFLLLGRTFHERSAFNWARHFSRSHIQVLEDAEVFEAARNVFEETAAKTAGVLAALKIASLELENRYRPDVHDEFFAHFNWTLFTEDEMALCPPVGILADTETLTGEMLSAFSSCLNDSYPIKLLATPQSGAGAVSKASRTEIAAIAVAHRNAYVLQTTALLPNALLKDFAKGLGLSAPAFFHIYSYGYPNAASGNSAFLNTCAAVESREFPGVRYDPAKGPHWGSRFELAQNPEPESDWPAHALTVKQGKSAAQDLRMSFTHADFAALDPAHAAGFKVVPTENWTDDLVPLEAYLGMDPEANTAYVPFVWMADTELQLHKVAVSWPLVQLCKQRLDAWHYFQENAGIHSYHVEQATGKLQHQLEKSYRDKITEAQRDLEQQRQAHAETAVREAMDRLAAALLDAQFSGLPRLEGAVSAPAAPKTAAVMPPPVVEAPAEEPAPTVASTAAPAAEAPAPPPPPPPPPVQESLEVEAYIDTPLCTSCNECIDNFPQIFAYNDDKQAFVSNPRGGSFSDIVRAAERCPVSIIHPGAPWEKDDPDLAELVERARQYQ